MLGKDYEEIGSSDKSLILKGKIKIQWGKKLIDLLDSNGNINVKVKQAIKEISSTNEIKENGFYYLNNNLLAKIGDNIIELTGESGKTYVSFLVEQDVDENQKYTALRNIGFVYKSQKDSNTYPTNGIIYIEDSQSLFIVSNGKLSKYNTSIQNPFTGQFIIQKQDQQEGALIIEGEGSPNSLLFNTLKIYSKDSYSILEIEKEVQFKVGNHKSVAINLVGLETDNIQSFGADTAYGYRLWKNNGKYVLDIDRINVREKINLNYLDLDNYYDDELYSKRFIISQFNVSPGDSNATFVANTNDIDISDNSLIEIPIGVIECSKTNVTVDMVASYCLQPISYISDEPCEELHRFRFKYDSGTLYFVDEDNQVISPTIDRCYYLDVKNKDLYDFIEINEGSGTKCYIFFNKDINLAFAQRSGYVISEPNNNLRVKMDFKNPEITLQQNDRSESRLSEYDQIIHTKIGNIRKEKTYSDDTNENGLFSDLNVFIGGEFRQPLPTKELQGGVVVETPAEIQYKHFPRYSKSLYKGITSQIMDHNEIILPKGKMAQALNYIEDVTSKCTKSGSQYTINCNEFYDGKLIIFKTIGTTSSSTLQIQFKNGEALVNNVLTPQYTQFYNVCYKGTAINEEDLVNTTILQYKNSQVNVLGILSYDDLMDKPYIPSIWTGSQSDYDNLDSVDNNTLYVIV